MNKAQKLLQPLIEAANEKYDKTPPDEYGEDDKSRADEALATIKGAWSALATLSDAITLADVPAVEWAADGHSRLHGDWLLWKMADGSYCAENPEHDSHFGNMEYCKRYVEIRIHLAAIERKLLAELAGGK